MSSTTQAEEFPERTAFAGVTAARRAAAAVNRRCGRHHVDVGHRLCPWGPPSTSKTPPGTEQTASLDDDPLAPRGVHLTYAWASELMHEVAPKASETVSARNQQSCPTIWWAFVDQPTHHLYIVLVVEAHMSDAYSRWDRAMPTLTGRRGF